MDPNAQPMSEDQELAHADQMLFGGEPTTAPQSNLAWRGIKRGSLGAAADITGALGYAPGSPFKETSDKLRAESEDPSLAATYGSYHDINGVKSFGGYAVERIAESIPFMASMMIPEVGVTGVAGKALTGLSKAERALKIAEGGAESLKLLGKEKIAEGLGQAASLGAATVQHLGETKAELEAEGLDSSFSTAIMPSIMKAGLDLVGVHQLFKAFGRGHTYEEIVSKAANESGFMSAIAKARSVRTAAATAAVEGTVEAFQQAVDVELIRSLKNQDLYHWTEGEKDSILEAFIGAGSAGGLTGFAGGLATEQNHIKEENPKLKGTEGGLALLPPPPNERVVPPSGGNVLDEPGIEVPSPAGPGPSTRSPMMLTRSVEEAAREVTPAARRVSVGGPAEVQTPQEGTYARRRRIAAENGIVLPPGTEPIPLKQLAVEGVVEPGRTTKTPPKGGELMVRSEPMVIEPGPAQNPNEVAQRMAAEQAGSNTQGYIDTLGKWVAYAKQALNIVDGPDGPRRFRPESYESVGERTKGEVDMFVHGRPMTPDENREVQPLYPAAGMDGNDIDFTMPWIKQAGELSYSEARDLAAAFGQELTVGEWRMHGIKNAGGKVQRGAQLAQQGEAFDMPTAVANKMTTAATGPHHSRRLENAHAAIESVVNRATNSHDVVNINGGVTTEAGIAPFDLREVAEGDVVAVVPKGTILTTQERARIKHITTVVKAIVKAVMPRSRIVIRFGEIKSPAGTITYGNMSSVGGGTLGLMRIDLGNLAMGKGVNFHLADTLMAMHEASHHVRAYVEGTSSKAMQDAVRREWNQVLRHAQGLTLEQIENELFYPGYWLGRGSMSEAQWEAAKDLTLKEVYNRQVVPQGHLNYLWSFEEYFADRVVGFMLKPEGLKTAFEGRPVRSGESVEDYGVLARSLYARVVATLRRMVEVCRRKFFPENMPIEKLIQAAMADAGRHQNLVTGSTAKAKGGGHVDIGGTGTLEDMSSAGQAPAQQLQADLGVKKSWFMNLLTMLQLTERYPTVQGQQFMGSLDRLNQIRARWVERADEIFKAWQDLGGGQGDNLGQFVMELSIKSWKEGKRFSEEEVQAMAQKHKLRADAVEVWRKMDQTFVAYGEELKAATEADMVAEQMKLTGVDEETARQVLAKELDRNAAAFAEWQKVHYFPWMRFGKFTLRLVAAKDAANFDGEAHNKGDTAYFASFETERERDEAIKELQKAHGDSFQYTRDQTTDDAVYSLAGLPMTVIERIGREMNMSPEQRDQLGKLAVSYAPSYTFRKQMLKRRGVAGMSEDAKRAFVSYFLSAGGHVARVSEARNVRAALDGFDEVMRQQRENPQPGMVTDDTMRVLGNRYRQHWHEVSKPGEEYSRLKYLGFLWYLGFSAKAAWVNLTQTPLMTYPVLAARFGDGKAVSEILKAMSSVRLNLSNAAGFEPGLAAAMVKLQEENLLGQHSVLELTGYNTFQRMAPRAFGLDRKMTALGGAATWMFRHAENANRQIVAIAAYRLAKKEGYDEAAAYAYTRDAIRRSQGEFSKFNMPSVMRSPLLLFYSFIQHSLYLAFGGFGGSKEAKKQAVRYWVTLFAAAGVMGLPGAELIAWLMGTVGTTGAKALGYPDIKVDVEESLRELLNAGDHDEASKKFTDIMMDGWTKYYGFGPGVDISGSLSMGWPNPGGRLDNLSGTPTEQGQQVLQKMGGPLVGIPFQILKAASTPDIDMYRRIGMMMPSAFRNAAAGWQILSTGKVESAGGQTVAKFDSPEYITMAALQALGFNPTAVSLGYEQLSAQQESVVFWQSQKMVLTKLWRQAMTRGDTEALGDVNAQISEFNKALKSPELRKLTITRKGLVQGLKQSNKMHHGDQMRAVREEAVSELPTPEGTLAALQGLAR